MEKQTALKFVFYVSLIGMLFSGYLSYGEIFQEVCALGTCSSSVFSVSSCVYGFVMYLVVFVISGLGVRSKK